MTYKSLFKLAIQLTGLYFIFISITGIPKIIAYTLLLQSAPTYGQSGLTISQFLSVVITAVLGLIMVYAAKKITDLFVKTDEPALLNVAKESILEVAMILLGIYIIAMNIPNISSLLVSLLLSEAFQIKLFLSSIISIVACFVIIYNARAISQFLVKIKTIAK